MRSSAQQCIDWRDVLAGKVRGIQSAYPLAHSGLAQWGRWSHVGVRKPRLVHPPTNGMFHRTAEDFDGYSDTLAPEDGDGMDAKPEASDDVHNYNERLSLFLDDLIHSSTFPKVWRRVLRTAYYRTMPEYQWPREMRLQEDSVVYILDGLLRFVEGKLDAREREDALL